MPDTRVQDEKGTIHVFPDEATPEMIAQAMGVKPPSTRPTPESQAPNAMAQAQAFTRSQIRPLIPGTATPDPTGGFAEAQKSPKYQDYMHQSGQTIGTTAGTMVTGGLLPWLKGAGLGVNALRLAGRSALTGAGAGAGSLAAGGSPKEAGINAAGGAISQPLAEGAGALVRAGLPIVKDALSDAGSSVMDATAGARNKVASALRNPATARQSQLGRPGTVKNILPGSLQKYTVPEGLIPKGEVGTPTNPGPFNEIPSKLPEGLRGDPFNPAPPEPVEQADPVAAAVKNRTASWIPTKMAPPKPAPTPKADPFYGMTATDKPIGNEQVPQSGTYPLPKMAPPQETPFTAPMEAQSAEGVKGSVPKPSGRLVLLPQEAQAQDQLQRIAKTRASQHGMQYAAGMRPAGGGRVPMTPTGTTTTEFPGARPETPPWQTQGTTATTPKPFTIANQMGLRAAKTPGIPDIYIPNDMADEDIPGYVAEKQALQVKGMGNMPWIKGTP